MSVLYKDNFLSQEEIDIFLEFYDFIDKNDMWESSTMDFWDGRTFEFSYYMKTFGDRDKFKFFMSILKRMQQTIMHEFGLIDIIYADTMQIVKWKDGTEQPPHADNVEQDGTPNVSPWRLYSGIIYLNDDYEGGQTYFPNLKQEIEPKAGRLGMFYADLEHTHGVKKVVGGERKTIITFWNHELLNKTLRLG
jgi:hypothetical protein